MISGYFGTTTFQSNSEFVPEEIAISQVISWNLYDMAAIDEWISVLPNLVESSPAELRTGVQILIIGPSRTKVHPQNSYAGEMIHTDS